MERLIEKLESITDFREALTLWVRAKHQAVGLEQEHKLARSNTYLTIDAKNHSEHWAKVDLETKDLARKAEMAKLRATAIFYLMLHLKGGDDVQDVDLNDM